MRAINVVIALAFLSFAAGSEIKKLEDDYPIIPEIFVLIIQWMVEMAFTIGVVFGGSWFITFQLFDYLAYETWCKLAEKDIGFFDYLKC
jgi:hypothetical protein